MALTPRNDIVDGFTLIVRTDWERRWCRIASAYDDIFPVFEIGHCYVAEEGL